MPTRLLILAMMSLWSSGAPAAARELIVEAEVLHIGGLLSATGLESMLADEGLIIEAHYSPTRLIEGETATRQRTMPFGSRLFAIPHYVNLKGGQIERTARSMRFRVADVPPEKDYYRLSRLELRTPVAPGRGRPQPHLSLTLVQTPPQPGAHETVSLITQSIFSLGMRVRSRWSDAQTTPAPPARGCGLDVQRLDDGQYRFRPHHTLAGFYRVLASDAASDPPQRPPPGQRSMRLSEPYPEPLTGWRLSRNHLLQFQVEGHSVERFSIHAEQTGSGQCRRTQGYDALYGNGRLVEIQRSAHHYGCGAEESGPSETVQARWLDDGSLSWYLVSTSKGARKWDAFSAYEPALCRSDSDIAAPPDDVLGKLTSEFDRIRKAFLGR
ncbi:MAG: hypothetical protein ACT4PS_12860 [Betaproteobacteria bacterium]